VIDLGHFVHEILAEVKPLLLKRCVLQANEFGSVLVVDLLIVAENAVERLFFVVGAVGFHAYVEHALSAVAGAEGLDLCDSHHAV